MHQSFSLGRIAGVKVGANWSVIVIIWLIAWSLAEERFPGVAPGYGTASYWVAAVLAAVAFFVCLLAHEFAHSLVARRFGVGIEGIVLWLFGGVSKFADEAPSADAELKIAVAGPAASMGIGVVFFGFARLLDASGGSPLVAAGLGWLGWFNGALALFNLLPAFPLDGGRVLRAWLWRAQGNKVRATAVAANAGRLFAYALIGLGLLQFLVGAVVGGLWFVFLGWFLMAAAQAESSQSTLEHQLRGMTVRAAMTADPIVVPATASVEELIHDWMFASRCSTFPLVGAGGKVAGLVTMARVKAVPADRRADSLAMDVAALPGAFVTCQADEPLWSVIGRLSGSVDQRALVFDGDDLVGVVSPSDITRMLNLAELAGSVGHLDASVSSIQPRNAGPGRAPT
ncbi:MAG: site-2 protease family protein [Microthrixaceae bacterium]